MPFRPASNPDLAAHFMAAGIQRAGASLGGAAQNITKAFAEKNKLNKAYTAQGEALGFDKNFLETLSFDEKMGLVESKKMKMAFDQMKTQMEAQQEQLEGDRAGRKGFSEALQRFSHPPAETANSLVPEFLQRPVTTRERMENAMTAPGLDMRGAGTLAQVANQYGDAAQNELRPNFQDIPGTDSVLATFGRSAYPVPKLGRDNAPQVKQLPNGGLAMWNGSRWIELRAQDDVGEQNTFFKTLTEGEKLLQGLDKQIGNYHDQVTFSKRNKSFPAPDGAVLTDLQKRRTEIRTEIEKAKEFFAKQQEGGGALVPRTTKLEGPDEMVEVEAPDGRKGKLPRSRLEAAKKAGYKEIK